MGGWEDGRKGGREEGRKGGWEDGSGTDEKRHPEREGWRNDSRGEGTRPWGPPRKGPQSVSNGPKPLTYIQLLQLLKNNPREVKRAHFRYILGPPGSHQGNGIYRARRGRSLPVPPRFLQPCREGEKSDGKKREEWMEEVSVGTT